MARISTYIIDQPVDADDKWIGSAFGVGATKNFTARGVASFLNTSSSIAGQTNFFFQTNLNPIRLKGSISFLNGGGVNTPFSSLTSIKVSKYSYSDKLIIEYLQTMVGLNILISQTDDINSFGVYKLNSLTQDPVELDFLDASLELVISNGALLFDKFYTFMPYASGVTDLSYTPGILEGIVNSSSGTDAVIPLAGLINAGLFSAAEKSKLSGIQAGAQINVNADWNATSGDAQILNKPIIPVITGFVPYTEATTNVDLGLNNITANSFIKSGGTSSQILAANGDVITAGTNITISGGIISSVGGTGSGGSSVNYYLNGGTSQGAFGGTTYYEFSKTAVTGTGADFSISSNGYIASFITDIADPSLLLIPGGNWNLEFFFSSSSNGGTPSFYVELYKYDGTTFTLIASNSATPEGITNGTSIDAYFTALAVPETVLTVNDRLAIRVFVNASSKTITLHTQNGHLCEVITTLTSGLTALNGLQAQVQNFATGTTGTDFAIVSSGSTHTFNLPSASATARGVVTIGTQTIAGFKTFTGGIDVALSGNAVIANSGQALALDVIGGNNGNAIGKFTRVSDSVEVARIDNNGLKLQLEIASTIASFDANKNVVSLTAANGYPTLAELKWLSGVTSSIQTQLNGKGSGTVTSVAALTLGTSGTDLSSSVANGSSTPVITLNVPDASATARGVITTGAQTIAGVKTFSSSPISVTPTASSNDTKVATTAYVDRQVNASNILITTATNITNATQGSSGGVDYPQHGRNVMINNGATAITLTTDVGSTPTDFIASYTKVGTATITFTFTGLTIVFPNGNLLSGGPGSTALLTRNGSTAYLLINNV